MKRVTITKVLYTEPITQLTLLAHRIHEAAHEGVVPLCEEYIWNPQLPWVSAQWTHEAAREGRVRLAYPSKERSGGILWECPSRPVRQAAAVSEKSLLAVTSGNLHNISKQAMV